MWAAVLGVIAVLYGAYTFLPMLTGTPPSAGSNAQAAAPVPTMPRAPVRPGAKAAKKVTSENLDPTLRLDLLAASEQTQYEGSGRNIFVSQAEDIPRPRASGATDVKQKEERPIYVPPVVQQRPIPLKFYGFASKPGEPKKIFLTDTTGETVWVAGEGEIVNRRYKVIRISPTSVQMQDVVDSGPPQIIPLTPG